MKTKYFWEEITWDDVVILLRPKAHPESRFKLVLFLVGVFLTPITLAGAIFGYWRAYVEYLRPRGIPAILTTYYPIVVFSMCMYSVLIWVFLFVVFYFYFGML